MSDEVSDTPRTDAFECKSFTSGEEEFSGSDIDKCLDFARTLERSIAELNQRLIDRTAAFMADKANDVARIRMLEADNARLAECAQEAYARAHGKGDNTRQAQAVGVEHSPVSIDGFLFAAPLGAALHLLWLLQRLSFCEPDREGQPCDGFRFRQGIIEARKLLNLLGYEPGNGKWPALKSNDSGKEGGE